jgi:hypothetical protein
MAYNVLKGVVEGSVDQYGDQEIDGVKVFKNTISASVFYDTDAQSPCATMKDVAIKNIVGGSKDGLLILENESTARVNDNLTFDGETLKTKIVYAKEFHGSAASLTDIPANQIAGKIHADSLNVGGGLHSVNGNVQINCGAGMIAGREGLAVNLSTNSGLTTKGSKLAIDLESIEPINAGGQNLSDNDLLMISDVSHKNTSSTTLLNFYESYISNKIQQSAGGVGDIQIKNKRGFTATSKFSYDTASDTLSVDGRIDTNIFKASTSLHCAGAVYNNIKTTDNRVYEIQNKDYTLLCNTSVNPVTVIVPPADVHTGRIINIKMTSAAKQDKGAYPIVLKTIEGTIDSVGEIIIETNHSSRTLQSDGVAWWVISSKGK